MSTRRRTSPDAERDPDMVGAEAAMHRAARHARRRTELATRGADAERPPAGFHGFHGTPARGDARELSFSQAHGYEDVPRPLRLDELPGSARTKIWNLFFSDLEKTMKTDDMGYYGPWVGGNWRDILQTAHVEFYILPLDDWRSDFWPICKKLRNHIETQPFNKVFDLLQFILRHRQCPRGFPDRLKRTFEACQLAYVIDTGPPSTILPAVTQVEGNSVVESLGALRKAGLHSSAAHLREASACINRGDWAASVWESISAVESVARLLDPKASKTLGPALASLERRRALHPALKGAFSQLYGYTNQEQGIRHALLDEAKAPVRQDEAVFMLGACASFASYLWRKHAAGEPR